VPKATTEAIGVVDAQMVEMAAMTYRPHLKISGDPEGPASEPALVALARPVSIRAILIAVDIPFLPILLRTFNLCAAASLIGALFAVVCLTLTSFLVGTR
jgi:hypothetical protein